MAFLYHESTGRTQESIRDVGGALFLMTCELWVMDFDWIFLFCWAQVIDSILLKNSRIFTQCYAVMHFYPAQLPILRRETNEHIYQFSAYYVAEIVNALPICFLRSFSGLTISYYWAGFNTGFLLYLKIGLTLMISSFTANAYGLMMSNMFKIAISEVASITDLIFLCISGFYMNLNSFPYIRYISLFFFSNEALAILFWSDVDEIGKHPTQFVFIQCLNVDFIFLFHFLLLFRLKIQNAHRNSKENASEMVRMF